MPRGASACQPAGGPESPDTGATRQATTPHQDKRSARAADMSSVEELHVAARETAVVHASHVAVSAQAALAPAAPAPAAQSASTQPPPSCVAPAPPPHPGGLGELDLEGLLTHPHLGVAVLQYLGNDTRAATALRGTCRGARDAVAGHRWHDARAQIVWPARWRASFPAATAANVIRQRQLTDADFVHFRGVRELKMSYCNQATITDAAFAHLAGIHTLIMCFCRQVTITDGAFERLGSLQALIMHGCNQATITDAAFAHLPRLHTLGIFMCDQQTITDVIRGRPYKRQL